MTEINKDSSPFESLASVQKLAWIVGLPAKNLRDLAKRSEDFYVPFDQRQNRNGKAKIRHIDNPTELLKAVQGRINKRLLTPIVFPREIVGGVSGRSIVDNAAPHVRQPELAKLDIENYFESVRLDQVAQAWRRWFKTGRDVTWLLTRLTTYQGHLPTGAPTSTAIANLVFLPIATELRALCAARGLRFTVYVDDLTLSGPRARETIEDAIRLLSRHGFSASRRKTEIMTNGFSQRVTGVVVNRKISNGGDRVNDIRRRILIGPGLKLPEHAVRIAGAIAHATAVCSSQGQRLRTLMERQTGCAR